MLGALLHALSVALHNLPAIQLDKLPRMADFAKLGAAASSCWGMEPGEFVALYDRNRREGNDTIVEASPLAAPLRALVLVSGKWEGLTSELLDALNERVDDKAKETKQWPATPID